MLSSLLFRQDRAVPLIVLAVVAFAVAVPAAGAAELPEFSFTAADDTRDWQLSEDVSALRITPDGLAVQSTGNDPYVTGPARDYPPDQLLWLNLRARCEREGALQVFYFRTHATEASSVRIPVSSGKWEDLRVPLPALGAGYRLRIDPPGGAGQTIISGIAFQPRTLLARPAWPKAVRPELEGKVARLQAGSMELVHSMDESGAFSVSVDGRLMAVALQPHLLGYVHENEQTWIALDTENRTEVVSDQDTVTVRASALDQHGGTWRIDRRFSAGTPTGAINVLTEVRTDRDRLVTFLPMLLLTPGAGSFGESKAQAIFPGLEYLDRGEPSSSEADLEGAQANRRVPDTLKITMPLMAIAEDDRYVGLVWERAAKIAALFDSPDRIFKSGGHAMGLIFPGSNGSKREEGNLLPHAPQLLKASEPLTLKATLIGGRGASVLPAVQQYVRLHGLPKPLPRPALDEYVRTAAAGWLGSAIREDDRYRHAFPGDFSPHPAADAAVMMQWLAERTSEAQLAARLRDSAKGAIAEVPPINYNASGVSHVRYPLGSLVFGHTIENAVAAKRQGQALLKRFEADGSVVYKAGKVDYGRTHFARDANGLTANLVERLLEYAAVSGDEALVAEGLRLLRALDRFKESVPRGAQTWEVPLHTPDILASAHLVRAYTLGYELTGDARFLEMARHWAWTGVPFLYLDNPVERPAGQYASIAVLGATNWVAPNWMGLPVQWCGLVYADALYRLAPHDQGFKWKEVADGITISGILQSWPADSADAERRGLLPDSFALRQGIRNDAAINPGTLQANAARLYDQPLYAFRSLRASGLLLHAPGAVSDVEEQPGRVAFRVRPWTAGACSVLLSRCRTRPVVHIGGEPAPEGAVRYDAENKLLALRVSGDVLIEIRQR